MGLHIDRLLRAREAARLRELGQLSEAQSRHSLRQLAGGRRDARPQEAELPDHGANGRAAGLERLQPQSRSRASCARFVTSSSPTAPTGRSGFAGGRAPSAASSIGTACWDTTARPAAATARPPRWRRNIDKLAPLLGRHDGRGRRRHRLRLRQHLGARDSGGLPGSVARRGDQALLQRAVLAPA